LHPWLQQLHLLWCTTVLFSPQADDATVAGRLQTMLVGYCVQTLDYGLMCPLVHTSTMANNNSSGSSSSSQACSSQVARSTW
jgi:hypothetical protein